MPTSKDYRTVYQKMACGGRKVSFILVVCMLSATVYSEVTSGSVEAAFELRETRAKAENGDALGQVALGLAYQNGKGVPRDESQAVQWYRKAAEQGNPVGQYLLGIMYAAGSGVPQDLSKAARLYNESAKQGNTFAKYLLGTMYEAGSGVRQSDGRAALWYAEAAEEGSSDAQRLLGIMYGEGRGVEQDDTQAVKWLSKAAEQGDADSQVMLGACHLAGREVKQDFEVALNIFAEAATRNGQPRFQKWHQLPARRGVLESPLALRSDGKNRIMEPGTYVIFLSDDKRMLHPNAGTFTVEPTIREGNTITINARFEGESGSESGDDAVVNTQLELTTDFLVRELSLDGAALPISWVEPVDEPRFIRTKTSALVSKARLNNGTILKITSREGGEYRQTLIMRDGQLAVASPGDVQEF
ncbi:tetratricopeptide repeat protein [Thiocapsa marina]|uniref:Sel1 domain protein repeat-containing protein n=1 Tax=Thiocapsa marina 5811 TaxID=768671 RepID=F9UH46_9GAMM|nr:tetratricopeptide repeat protein [Thiocapsa marina]EGV16450.1 Sel1 domain protein repeat-containing protein [Thiocapsa marina 5811]